MAFFRGEATKVRFNSSKFPYVLGQSFTYAYEHGFDTICRIPETAARIWLESLGYELNKGYRPTQEPETSLNRNQWFNKLALVVEVGMFKVTALYNHDGEIWVVQKR